MNLITYQWHKKEIKTSNKINRRGRDGGYIYFIYQNWRVGVGGGGWRKLNMDLPQSNQNTGYTSWTGDKVDDVTKNFQVSLPAVNQVCYYRIGLLFPSEWTTHFTRLNSNK